MNKPLVIITRPVAKQTEAVRLFTEAGLSTLSLPMMTTEIQNTEHNFQQLKQAQSADAVIFPSVSAVQACFAIFPDFSPQASTVVIAVGPATADCWAEFSAREPLLPQSYNSEGVIEVLKQLDKIEQLYLMSAPEGRGLIQEYCDEKGIPYQQVDVYKRIPLSPSEEQVEQLMNAYSVVLTFTSLAAFHRYQEVIPSLPKTKVAVVCASARIAEEVKAHDYGDVLTADSASDTDMLAVIRQL